jgi:hypothetical protein
VEDRDHGPATGDFVEQFCTYQRKQRGRTEGGVKTYRWNLDQFVEFVRARHAAG